MAVTISAAGAGGRLGGDPVVNDFSIQVATVNGSGSQSANLVLLRSIFRMGIPVSGKNLFPSNIAGLPTWFTIRVNKHGYIARKAQNELVVAMNPETIVQDEAALMPGAVFIYNSDLKFTPSRADVVAVGVPFGSIVASTCQEAKLRKLVTNMVYVGVLAQLIGIELDEIEAALSKQFKGKQKAVALNFDAIKAGAEWAKGNLSLEVPYRLERMDRTQGKIIIEGNRAAALGCLFAGTTVVAWYPITPSTSLCENLIGYLEEHRLDPETGKATFGAVQAEDELAAAGMVFGAGWAGARAMTATSGPGISLMNEIVGLAYFTELPGVIFDVQRVGPSTGLPTRTQQGDLLALYHASHGDTKHPVLIPATPQEAYEFAYQAFDLSERFQTPVFVMLDLDLGMNSWMADPFPYLDSPLDRGPVVTADALSRRVEAAPEGAKHDVFGRYRDVLGDGIPERTLPGTPHPLAAYFTRGSGHTSEAKYSEKPEDYTWLVDRLARKHETARKHVPSPVEDWRGAEVSIVSYGTSEHAAQEARDLLAEQGISTNYLRVRALPFAQSVKEFVKKSRRVYVIDQNRDGQMHDLLRLEIDPADAPKIRSIRHYDGMSLDAMSIVAPVLEMEKH
ncbi:MAG TPA: 2-oxoacid:acceptor oxidoreductase subunit alpha [Pantanalinema sp.]